MPTAARPEGVLPRHRLVPGRLRAGRSGLSGDLVLSLREHLGDRVTCLPGLGLLPVRRARIRCRRWRLRRGRSRSLLLGRSVLRRRNGRLRSDRLLGRRLLLCGLLGSLLRGLGRRRLGRLLLGLCLLGRSSLRGCLLAELLLRGCLLADGLLARCLLLGFLAGGCVLAGCLALHPVALGRVPVGAAVDGVGRDVVVVADVRGEEILLRDLLPISGGGVFLVGAEGGDVIPFAELLVGALRGART